MKTANISKPFLVAVGGSAVILLVTLLLPLGFDNDLYEAMGWTLYAYHGLPYLASWDHNFPGIVFIHWMSIVLFGASDFGFRLFDYIVHIAMAGFYYRVLRNWLSPTVSVFGVLLFALYYASGQWGLAGQRDTYAAFLLLGAVFAFVKLRNNEKHATVLPMIVGILCGATFLIRPTYVFFAIAFLILLFMSRSEFKTVSFYLVGCALPIISFLLPYIFVPGGLLKLYNTIIRFNLDVYSSVHVPISWWSRGRGPIFGFAAAGIILMLWRARASKDHSDRTMFLLLAGSALLSPIIMGKYFSYHFEPFFLLSIPFAAVGLMCAVDYVTLRWLRVAIYSVALTAFAYAYYPRHLLSYYWEALKNSSSPLEATYDRVLSDSLFGRAAEREVVNYIDRSSLPSDRVEYVSIFPGLRWRLHRQPATRFTSIVPLSAYTTRVPDYAVAWRLEFLNTLATTPPRYLIVSRSKQWWPYVGKTNDSAIASIPGFDSLLTANYSLDTVIRGFALYRSHT